MIKFSAITLRLFLQLVFGISIAAYSFSVYSDEASERVVLSDAEVRITLRDLEQELALLPDEQQRKIRSDRDSLYDFLNGLYLDMRMEQYADETGFAKRPEMQALLQRTRRMALAKALIEHYLEEARSDQPNFESLAHDYYKAYSSEFVVPEAVKVSYILFKVDVENLQAPDKATVYEAAQEALTKIRNGADFSEVGKQYEEQSDFYKMDEVQSWLTRGQTVKPFEDAAFQLAKPGDVSDIVRTRFGFHIIQLNERRSESVQPFEAVKTEIIGKLHAQFLKREREEFVHEFYPDDSLVVNDKLIKSLLSHKAE